MRASSLGPPRKNSWGRAPPPPLQKDGALTSCGGPSGQFLPQNLGKNGQIFPLTPKAPRGIPQRAYNSLQIGSNLRKNCSKTQKLLQKCPWWRQSVHIVSKTLKTTPKYVKTALRAPKARAKNFSQNLPPQNFYLGGGGAPPSLARPLHETLHSQCSTSSELRRTHFYLTRSCLSD